MACMRQVNLERLAPCLPLPSATHLLDLGVGTAVEHEPLGHGAGPGVGGRRGPALCLVAGSISLYTMHVTIQKGVII